MIAAPPDINMTPEQTQYFLDALAQLIDATAQGKLTAPQFRSGVIFLWLGRSAAANGFVDIGHVEAWAICDTDANSTMRNHLIKLRNAGILREYSTNGTVRVKFATYPGREMITHPRKVLTERAPEGESSESSSLSEQSSSLSEQLVLTERAPEGESSESSSPDARLRALNELLRAYSARPSRNFDSYANQTGSMLVSKLDHTNIPERDTDKLASSSTINPLEEAQSMSLMLDVGFWPNTAKSLAKIYPFSLIRQAVGHWYMNRRSAGGQFADKPGIVVTWLNNPETTFIPPLSAEFMATDLYQRHRTKAEIAADAERERQRQAEEAAAQQAQLAVVEDDLVPDTIDEPDMQDGYESVWMETMARIKAEVNPGSFNTWVAGACVHRVDGSEWVIVVESSGIKTQLEQRFQRMIQRTLSSVWGRAAQVVFVVKK